MLKKPRNVLLLSLLAVWAIACLAVVSQIHSFHYVSFWPDASLSLASSNPDEQWSLTHVLGSDCKCSSVVSEYLLKRGPVHGLQENILILGSDPAMTERFQTAGYQVQQKNPEELEATDHALGIPFLIVTTPKQQTLYAGGYGDRKIVDGSPIRDLEILDSLKGGRTPANFPIFGCVASLKFQKLTDPFKMKYPQAELNQ